jgi:hypothetical protein
VFCLDREMSGQLVHDTPKPVSEGRSDSLGNEHFIRYYSAKDMKPTKLTQMHRTVSSLQAMHTDSTSTDQ